MREVALGASFAVLASGMGGCVHVYQPMSGLHEPVVVDPQMPNFEGMYLTVRCLPGDFVNRQETSALCRKVATLFENQGATVNTVQSLGQADEIRWGQAAPEAQVDDSNPNPTNDLTVELRGRQLHQAKYPVSWAMCVSTFTLFPGISESTFAQDVVIRDGNGFLLVSDTLKGRLIRRFGLGTWVGNKILDLTWRKDDDKLTGEAANEDLSRDLYGQLSQLTFNAKVQWQIAQESTGVMAPLVPPAPAVPPPAVPVPEVP